jgi:archaellin
MRSAELTKNEISIGIFVLDVTGQETNNKVHRLTISIHQRPSSNDFDLSNLRVEVAYDSKMILLIFKDNTTWNFNVILDNGQVFCTGT